jgi:hypothetical protein
MIGIEDIKPGHTSASASSISLEQGIPSPDTMHDGRERLCPAPRLFRV